MRNKLNKNRKKKIELEKSKNGKKRNKTYYSKKWKDTKKKDKREQKMVNLVRKKNFKMKKY